MVAPAHPEFPPSPRGPHEGPPSRGRSRERGMKGKDRSPSSGSAASFLSDAPVTADKRLPTAIVKDLLSFEQRGGNGLYAVSTP